MDFDLSELRNTCCCGVKFDEAYLENITWANYYLTLTGCTKNEFEISNCKINEFGTYENWTTDIEDIQIDLHGEPIWEQLKGKSAENAINEDFDGSMNAWKIENDTVYNQKRVICVRKKVSGYKKDVETKTFAAKINPAKWVKC